jgi:endonuclease G
MAKTNYKKYSKFLLFTIISSVFFYSCSSPTDSPVVEQDPSPYKWVNSIHTNPGVAFDKDTTDDYMIVRNQYVVNYNKVLNVPNYVCWELNADWFGDVSRYSGNFITDTSLPAGIYRVVHSDYTNSGFDRGHLCMSDNRTKTVEDNKATFIITNIFPQMPDLNQGVWLRFESYCSDLARNQNKELFITAGGIYRNKEKIKGIVTIPDSCYKIVVILEKGQTYKDISSNTQVVSVVMPNISGVRGDAWEKYSSTVRQIENSTGFNFLSKVPKAIQDVIENRK